jgi:hypothetical protein
MLQSLLQASSSVWVTRQSQHTHSWILLLLPLLLPLLLLLLLRVMQKAPPLLMLQRLWLLLASVKRS